MIGSRPSLITIPNSPMRFLIMDTPRANNLHLYIKECKKHNVTAVTRVCEEKLYEPTELLNAGIQLHELPYPDGHSPPEDVLDRWLDIVHQVFYESDHTTAAATTTGGSSTDQSPCIAVHCVAGLGRAPVLVAIAMIEFGNMDPVEAVVKIRKVRRGAINDKQLNWLESYKKRYKKHKGVSAGGGCCVIS